MTRMRTSLRIAAIVSLGLTSLGAHSRELPTAPAGDVQFFPINRSSFDVHTRSPSESTKQWMRDHYTRMRVFTPYFDKRLVWYPDAWFYKNSYGIRINTTTPDEHPDWILKDAGGNRLYLQYACSGGTCPRYAADIGNAQFRNWWIDDARATLQGGYRGIYIDDVNLAWRISNGNGDDRRPIDPRTGSEMTLENWRRYFAEFLEQVRAELPDAELSHNAIWYATDRSFSDPYLVRQVDAADLINLERGAVDRGLVFGTRSFGFETFLSYIDFVHSRNRNVTMADKAATVVEREFGLASWFLVSNGGDLVSTESIDWSGPVNWWHGYDLTLGNAAGPRYHWNGLLRRDFDCGSVFVNQPDAPRVTTVLADTYYTLEGTARTSLDLAAREAAILLRGCRVPEAPSGVEVN